VGKAHLTNQPKDQKMKTDLKELYRYNPTKACRLALRRTASLPWQRRMAAIDALLGLYGVERVQGDCQNGYWCNVACEYANTGDTYAVTVICQRGETAYDAPRFLVANVGDWFERNERRLGLCCW
jgi:hypothetical protein